mmetsp:Transcript_28449/g.89888  ORF Transcript_28449/g.89888 Transcript_28449/m.89888 type:complete len:80 (+) Transcript_28449:101-340(+)
MAMGGGGRGREGPRAWAVEDSVHCYGGNPDSGKDILLMLVAIGWKKEFTRLADVSYAMVMWLLRPRTVMHRDVDALPAR